jgi:hypothetical protein
LDNLLSGLFGGQDNDDDDVRRQRAGDFVQRVERGNAAEDVSTKEVVQNYRNVASQLPDDEYVGAARDALSRFSPEQRREFGQILNQHTGANIQGDIDDPQEIAQITNQLRSSEGGGLAGLLGGSGSDDLMGAISGLIGGGGGSATRQEGGISDLLSNPIVKSILAAIAAMAMKKYAGGGAGGGLSGLFGGDDSPGSAQPQTPGGTTRPRDNPRTSESGDNDGGGGLLDSLFGGGDDRDEASDDTRKRDRGDILKRKDKPQSI